MTKEKTYEKQILITLGYVIAIIAMFIGDLTLSIIGLMVLMNSRR